MASVQAALEQQILENSFLQFGLGNGLFNLSQLARFLKVDLQSRIGRDLSESSLVMALSRASRSLRRESRVLDRVELRNIQVSSNLAILTYEMSQSFRPQIAEIARDLQSRRKHISFAQGLSQVTLFVERDEVQNVERRLSIKPIQAHYTVAVIGARLDSTAIHTPGFFFAIFQQLYIQKINVLEISSTSSELLIYVEEKDLRQAFDTLYNRFAKGAQPSS